MNHTEALPEERHPGAVARAVLAILARWDLDPAEQATILGLTQEQYLAWTELTPSLAELEPETVLRLSALLGIYQALRTLYADDAIADSWIKRPNRDATFAGRRPLDRMLQGGQDDLMAVRRFLDGWTE